ncbi:MAG: BrnT family toxin [Bacteriovorax sp.]|nr:BrnT family toxin [Bacteriovorax sp.]
MALEYHDLEHSTKDEDRFIRIGMSFSGVLVVVFCERLNLNGEEVTRIISARNADSREVDKYYEN